MFHVEHVLFGQPKVQEAYNIIHFCPLMENSILKIFGSVDVKITPDFKILKRFVFFTTYLCLDKVQWGTGHEISDLCDGIQFSFFSFQRTKVTKKYWPQLWVPQWSWFQTVSKAGKLDNQFEYISSSDKLFASMRNNEELDMIFQTDMMSNE